MRREEATKIGKQLEILFDVYFKNNFLIRSGKHWREVSPEDANHVALKTISTKCDVMRVSNSVPSVYAFRFTTDAARPKFVEPSFHVPKLQREIERFFDGKLHLVNCYVDLRKGSLFFALNQTGSKQYYHFEFQIKK
jgi:hypothetical protein